MGISPYLDLRRFGTVPHAGFAMIVGWLASLSVKRGPEHGLSNDDYKTVMAAVEAHPDYKKPR